MTDLDKINRSINEALWTLHRDPDLRESENALRRFRALCEKRRALMSGTKP